MKKLFLVAMMLLSGFANAAELKTYNVTLTKDNTVVMNKEFDGDTVAQVAQKARELDSKLKSKEPLFLVLDSPGGSIFAGMELIENLNNLNRPVHTISIFSASMGFQTVQGVKGKRLMVPNGTLMSHKARGGVSGEFPGQLDSRYSYILSVVQDLDKRVVSRTGGTHTFASYEALIENEYWCTPASCVKQGLADGVASVKCDSSLGGTHETVMDKAVMMGMALELIGTFSDCPTTTSALEYNITVDGKKLFTGSKDKSRAANELAPYLTTEQTTALQGFIDKGVIKLFNSSRDRKIEYYRK